MEAYQVLAQEPWCFSPKQIGCLTDWQIEHLYVRPAVERSRRNEIAPAPRSLGKQPEPVTGPPGEPGSPAHRSACIGAYMTVQGLNRERAESQYDQQLAQYHAERTTGGKHEGH